MSTAMIPVSLFISTLGKHLLYFTVLSLITVFDLHPGVPRIETESGDAEPGLSRTEVQAPHSVAFWEADLRVAQRAGISLVLRAAKARPEAVFPGPSVITEMASEEHWWPGEVQKTVDRESGSPLELMRVDRYYWMHYLVEMEPEIE